MWLVQKGIDLIQFEVTTLEQAGFVMCDACKCVFQTFLTNESTTSCNQPRDVEAWPKTHNNKPIW
jgi:hypothetical protein